MIAWKSLSACLGEFVVLVGPSGCGKSTLLRRSPGLEEGQRRGDTGSAGASQRGSAGRAISPWYFNAMHFILTMSVPATLPSAWNAEAPPRRSGRPPSTAQRSSESALCSTAAQAVVRGTAPARCDGPGLVRRPKAFLFDEPLSNLDARLRGHMRAEIKKLHRELGATSIYVTHDQIEAMTLADRIVAMNGGHVQQVGSPLELYDQPANLFVAGFIGSPAMNMFPGDVQSS